MIYYIFIINLSIGMKQLIKVILILFIFFGVTNSSYSQGGAEGKRISIKKRERLQKRADRKKKRKEKKIRRKALKQHRKRQSKAVRKRMRKNRRRDNKRKNH